ncbi:nuclear transport factor 2 family protein [Microbacterium sp. MYb62]|uniref:nuclear transport factor 2 family protein n=1 Tax=Microbacterium sp. MYb62 TaxID=1848690 RepID=UPI000CFCE277|nr:nuclear transport factor 2 family protein [Microbacterium sp. MYb62]PRB18403.1 DUF4440 domain-containing protein [Microbacterium sp. MYb62]
MATRDDLNRTADQAEDLLLDAMRQSDVDTLSELLSPDLAFTVIDGSVVGRDADLEAHRSGATRFESLTELERSTQEQGGQARTRSRADIVVFDRGNRVEAVLGYERSWSIVDGRWQVVSGSVSLVDG